MVWSGRFVWIQGQPKLEVVSIPYPEIPGTADMREVLLYEMDKANAGVYRTMIAGLTESERWYRHKSKVLRELWALVEEEAKRRYAVKG